MTARDYMRNDFVSVSPEATAREAAELLQKHAGTDLPVVDQDGRFLGLISESDILALAIPLYLEPVEDLSFLPGSTEFPPEDALDLDTTTVEAALPEDAPHHVAPNEAILEVVRVMVHGCWRCCAVVAENRLVGLIHIGDLLQTFLAAHNKDGADE